MPPRYAYWTILIDNAPTAFRAKLQEDLLPTLKQLQNKQPTAIFKWFSRGRLWDSPEQERDAYRARRPAGRQPAGERRGREWRPGGEHRDPRDRFKKRKGRRDIKPRGKSDKDKR